MISQPFLYPSDLLNVDADLNPAWTCARTRPRWEKRFSRWLRAADIDHFLPVVRKQVRSHRKTRTTELPLFPGYVFVRGTHSKQAFSRSAAVAFVLHPRSPRENREVNDTLVSVWRMLTEGRDIAPVQRLVPGEDVEVIAGSLAGTHGTFVREGAGGRIVIWIDLLGVGVSAELEDASMVAR